ncbi:DUF222 domain-containing protein [Microbacterium sp. NPDC096154]|uniref:HNH endonuclease signature motif containing protein n=1 Tax=Microbacterium sp. NPDC096154 TaxID=3155549 RepID=UPI0033327EBF
MTTQATAPGSWVPTPGERARAGALLDEFVDVQQQISRLQARAAAVLAGLAEVAAVQARRSGSESEYEFASRSMAAEVGAAVRVPDGTIRARMAEAVTLVTRFPATFAALEEGRIGQEHARVVVAAGERIEDDDSRAEYETVVLTRAERMTAGRLRSLAKTVADKIEPLPLVERHAEAMTQRGVWVTPLEEGMGELRVVLPAVLAFGVHDRLTQMARTLKRTADDGDDRTVDHLRADLLADLLLTGTATAGEGLDAIRATVQVTIPVDTVTGLGDESAFLAGYGPVDPDTARRLAGNTATWVRLFTDRDTGCLRTADTYTPTAAQRRFLAARDEHCRFPGCRQPATRCDIDHTIPHAEHGPTDVGNLAHLCESHHRLKHHTPWQMSQGPGGVIHWTSPLGRRYAHQPTPAVRFQALDDIPMPDLAIGEPAPF